MNAFEKIVGQYLEEEGYWVRQSVKVHISKQDKVDIGKYSMPTPEIDLVALNMRKNEMLLIEAKSFLDSYGVWFEAVSGEDAKASERYKLFTNSTFREIVTERLRKEYLDRGLINKNTKINYALAAGHIHSGNEEPIAEYFSKKGWRLFTPTQIREYVKQLASKGWEDDLVTMTTKLISR